MEENEEQSPVSLLQKKLGRCEVCAARAAKYTCPRCEVKSCSSACVKIHKHELQCSGLRDKTLYKPLHKFNNLDLLSDLRLLEDIGKSVVKYQKDVNKRWTRYKTTLPIQLYKLRCTAYARGVRLMFLPQNFSKHKENTTYYDWKTRNLYWKIEWVFFGKTTQLKFTDPKVKDTTKLGTLVGKFFNTDNRNSEMEFYYSFGESGVIVLMKAEKSSDKYHELDLDLSLRENLRNKMVIEHPTFLVIFKHNKDEYDIHSEDEMLEKNEEDKPSEIEVFDVES